MRPSCRADATAMEGIDLAIEFDSTIFPAVLRIDSVELHDPSLITINPVMRRRARKSSRRIDRAGPCAAG